MACDLSSCGTRAWLLLCPWDLPGPGIKPTSPAPAGGFLSTVPQGEYPSGFRHWIIIAVVHSPSHVWLLRPYRLQHARLPGPSPRVCPSSRSLLWWCHPAISSSDVLFSFCPQFFPASGTFPTSTLFSSDGQNTGASASASVLLVTIQGWYPLRLTGLISLLSKGLSGFFSSTTVQRHQFFDVLPCYGPALTIVHDLWEHRSLEYMALCQQSNVSAFQHIVYICHCFPAKKRSSSDFMAAVNICSDFGAQEKEICHNFHLFPFCLPWSNGTGCHDLSFFNI